MRAALLLIALLAPGAVAAQEAGAPSAEQSQLDFADGLFGRGFYAEAAEEYQRFLDQYPQAAGVSAALYRLGEAALAAGKPEQALAALDRLAGLSVDEATHAAAALTRGEALVQLERWEAAVGPLEAASMAEAAAPNARGRALYLLGKARQHLKDLGGAVAAYQALVASYPDHPLVPFAHYQMGFALLARGDPENAAVEFSSVAASGAEADLRAEARYRAAEIYMQLGWSSAAAGAYEQLMAEFPDTEYAQKALSNYAWALFHTDKFDEALAMADRAVEKAPPAAALPGLLFLRASCLQQKGDAAGAIGVFQQLTAAHQDSEFGTRALYRLAWLQYRQGNLEEARKLATEFIQKAPESPQSGDAAFLLGSVLVREGTYEGALQQFRLVAEKYPDSEFGAEALYRAGECLGYLGLNEQAAAAFDEFEKRFPKHRLAVEGKLRAADAALAARDFKGAAARYEAALMVLSDRSLEEQVRYRLALSRLNAGDVAASTEAFSALVETFPESAYRAEALFRIGEYRLLERNDPIAAIDAFQAAFDTDPKGPFAGPALRNLALAHYEHKDFDQAAPLFLRLGREFPQEKLNEETYAWAAQYLYDARRWDEAAEMFSLLLQALPDYPNPERVKFLIADCVEQAGRTEEALALFSEAAALAPGSAKALEAQYRMAALHEKAGRTDQAIAGYEAAAAASNGDMGARAQFRLGELYEAQGDCDKAARSYMRVAILFLHQELSPESLLRAARCYEKQGNVAQARKAYGEILADFPEAAQAGAAREALAAPGG